MITDHALLRYIERVHGVDVEKLRDQVAEHCRPYCQSGVTHAEIGNVWAMMRSGRVITFLPCKPTHKQIVRYCQPDYHCPSAEPSHWKHKARKRMWR